MAVASGSVAMNSATPTAICAMGESGALVTGSVTGTFVGGPNVTTATGIPVPATPAVLFVPGARTISSQAVPAGADNVAVLYGIAVTGTPSVNFLAPQGG